MKEKVIRNILQKGTVSLPPDLLWGYRQMGLDEPELVLVLLILGYSQQYGDQYPDLGELSVVMGTPVPEVQGKIASLIEKGFLDITSDFSFETGEKYQVFSLDPLYDRLGAYMAEQESRKRDVYQEKKREELEERDSVYTIFEQEFGRLLTPMETGYLREWIDGDLFSRELVFEALRSAVSREKRNFKYIDTILRNWEKKGIRTAREARLEDQNFSGKKKAPAGREKPAAEQKPEDKTFRKKTNYDDLIMN